MAVMAVCCECLADASYSAKRRFAAKHEGTASDPRVFLSKTRAGAKPLHHGFDCAHHKFRGLFARGE